jgi:hypothetical protein
MAALVLLPPLPPEEVARGQVREASVASKATSARTSSYRWQRGTKPSLWLNGLDDITFEVWTVDDKGRRTKYVAPAPQAAVEKPRRRIPTKLRVWEREQMDSDVAVLTRAGVYESRPRHGNGIDGDCPTGPCGFVSCRHNLFITVRPTGAVKMNFPGKEIDEVGETCSLRVAAEQPGEGEPMSFRKLNRYFNETHGRAQQVSAEAERSFVMAWAEMYPDDPPPRFRKG